MTFEATVYGAVSNAGLPNNSQAYDLGAPADDITIQILTTGSPTFSVIPMASEDGVNYISGTAITATGMSKPFSGLLVRFVKFSLTALSGGTFTLIATALPGA
jgi:hypothetical protein